MKMLMAALLLTACSSHQPAPKAPPRNAPEAHATGPAVRLWIGDTRQIDGHWAVPSLHARAQGADLQVDVAVSVGTETELTAADVTAKLYAGSTQLTCSAPEPLGFTETVAITAQATFHCVNGGHALPTRLVIEVKQGHETFAIQLSSLTTAG